VLEIQSLFTEYTNELGQPVKAAQDVNISVPEGHFFTLLGPSGCGKTTTLRSIAGLERPKSGEITVSGTVVYSGSRRVFVPPNQRGFGMVFQSYAIERSVVVLPQPLGPSRVKKCPSGTEMFTSWAAWCSSSTRSGRTWTSSPTPPFRCRSARRATAAPRSTPR
jgi:ABC-type polar amino acid transport system ATPase subunit